MREVGVGDTLMEFSHLWAGIQADLPKVWSFDIYLGWAVHFIELSKFAITCLSEQRNEPAVCLERVRGLVTHGNPS